MRRFFGIKENDKIIIENDEFFHLSKVLRKKENDDIIACINDEFDYFCSIEKMNKNFCICKINEIKKCEALPKKNIVLFQMMPKKEYFDNILSKSIELGVNEIYFFSSSFTMIKSFKRERVNTQVLSACKQCERSKLVEVHEVISFDEMIEKIKEFDISIFAYENENKKFAPQILDDKNNIAVIVGNEAGFSDEEANKIIKAGATSVSLGTRILRCDTAVLTMIGLISVLSEN